MISEYGIECNPTLKGKNSLQFCEHQESLEMRLGTTGTRPINSLIGRDVVASLSQAQKSSAPQREAKHKRQKLGGGLPSKMSTFNATKFCTLHQLKGHDLLTCKVMRDQAEKM